jgi:phosphate transport system substrate-binding protein
MKIIKTFRCITFAVVMWAALVFVGHAQTTTVDRIKVGGATTVTDYIQSWIPEFEAKNPAIGITLVASSTGRGLQDLFSGSIDVSMASREISEKDKGEASRSGVALRITFLARGAVAFVVHPSNPVNELSVEQLALIFGGKYVNWKEVGGPELSILVLVPPPDRATGVVVSQEMLKTPFSHNAQVVATYLTTMKVMERNSATITFIRPSLAFKGGVKPLAIRTAPGSTAIQLSRENIRTGTYPFTRPLQLCYDGNKNTHNAAIQRFIEFCVAKAGQVEPD